MNHKVILADDSLTIQKVIKITLANQPYEITDCSSESELFSNLEKVKPKIVFLDFNLSEKYTGYDLASKIKKTYPLAKILFLLGTFDTLDEELFKKCGASDHIVKPFDSNKFISICKKLIQDFKDEDQQKVESKITIPKDEDLEFPNPIEEKNDEDLWEMNSRDLAQTKKMDSEKKVPNESEDFNPLEREISDWGMSLPGVINKLDSFEDTPELPPIIEELSTSKAPSQEHKLPSDSDLDYPDLNNFKSESKLEDIESKDKSKKKPQLISIETFSEPSTPLEIQGNYVEDTTDINKIHEQIQDEIENDLWKVDEFENSKSEFSLKNEVKITKENKAPHLNKLDNNQSLESLKPELELMVKKYVQEYMDQMFIKNVEKISWEIIPDLAENLIRQELSKISNKIINE